jgi:hypothetical protein
MRETSVKERGGRWWARVRSALPLKRVSVLIAGLGLLIAALGLLITVTGLWFREEGRARRAEAANIRLEGEVTDLRRHTGGLGAALRECSGQIGEVAAHASERALQFYVTDTDGRPVVGAAVSALRTRERVVTRESGLTDPLAVRVGDKVAIAREGFESREVVVSEKELTGLVVDVELRR